MFSARLARSQPPSRRCRSSTRRNPTAALEIKIAYGASLGPERQAPESIKSGGYEGALMCAGYYPNKFPLLTVMELPFLPPRSILDNAKVNQAILKHPLIVKEIGGALEHQVFRSDLSSGVRVHGQQAHRIGRRHEGREDAHCRPQRKGAAGVRGGADDGDGAGRL